MVGSLVSARYGRRVTMCVMSVWVIATSTIVITANSVEQLLPGRILHCMRESEGHPPIRADLNRQMDILEWSFQSCPSSSPKSFPRLFADSSLAPTN